MPRQDRQTLMQSKLAKEVHSDISNQHTKKIDSNNQAILETLYVHQTIKQSDLLSAFWVKTQYHS